MSYLGITGNGPTFEYPLVEQNETRQLRPIVIKCRKVKGKRGWLLRRVGKYIAPDPSPEGLSHRAVVVGSYLHELHTDEANQKYLVVQRLTGEQIWTASMGESIKGYTNMTDQQIADEAMRVQSWMRGRQGGKYNVRKNNCHDFVNELTRRLCVLKKVASDNSSLDESDWGSTITLSTALDEKMVEQPHQQIVEVMSTTVREKGPLP